MVSNLLLALAGAFAAAPQSFLTRPDVHGDRVVFTAEGDLWLGSIKERTARRLTSDAGNETNARFSPDGRMIAFSGQYDGGNDVYVMPVEGGAPRRLTFDPKTALVQGWAPDGKSVIFRSSRYSPVGGVRRIFAVPVEGGLARELPVPRGDFASMGPNGLMAYVPVSNEWANWFHYRAGRADDVWLVDTRKKAFQRLTSDPGIDTTPVWCGDSIYFVSERSGPSNLFRLDPATKAAKQVTFFKDNQVRYPGSDGSTVVFQHGPGLAIYEPGSGKVADLTFDLNSDRIHSRETRVPLTVINAAIGPTGKRVAIESRGQIVSVAAENGDMRVLENSPGSRATMPAWSGDGKRVAFVSDRTGENEIWIASAEGNGEAKQLTRGLAANPFGLQWSPDSSSLITSDRDGRLLLIDAAAGTIKVVAQADRMWSYDGPPTSGNYSPDGRYIAYQMLDTNWIEVVYVYDIAAAKSYRLSSPDVNSYAPAFSADGKFVIYLADRQITSPFIAFSQKFATDNITRVTMVALAKDTPSPFLPKNEEEGAADKKTETDTKTRLDPEGLDQRVIDVPMPAGRYTAVAGVPGRILVLSLSQVVPIAGSAAGLGEILAFDVDRRRVTTLMSGIDGFWTSLDNKKLLVRAGDAVSVVDAGAQAAIPPATGRIDLSPYSLAVKPDAEWRQIFNESWRIARDFYFDPGMHGLDWNAVRSRYAAQLPMVGDRSDLTRLIADMVSELNTGHAYVNAPPASTRRVPMGYLGADYEPVAGGNGVRIKKLYRGDAFSISVRSPLLEPGVGVKEGDLIVAIGGQAVKSDQDIQALLVGLTNQTVAVTVADAATPTNTRIVRVRPLSSEDALRYQDWVQGRERYVREHGGENLGYLHVPDMSLNGAVGFMKGQFQNVYKDGMIYDTRYNTGGFISSILLNEIAATPQAWWKPRYGGHWTREAWANWGYKVALCNEYNFSDGELFVEVWKKMKIGPVVGVRTGGGEVGSGGGYALVDGGSIYIPNYAAFADGKWIVEGTGATPDVEVEQDPALVMSGRDPQLDRAIDILKGQIAKNPIKPPVHPPFPRGEGSRR